MQVKKLSISTAIPHKDKDLHFGTNFGGYFLYAESINKVTEYQFTHGE